MITQLVVRFMFSVHLNGVAHVRVCMCARIFCMVDMNNVSCLFHACLNNCNVYCVCEVVVMQVCGCCECVSGRTTR